MQPAFCCDELKIDSSKRGQGPNENGTLKKNQSDNNEGTCKPDTVLTLRSRQAFTNTHC